MFLILYHSDIYRELTLEGADNMDHCLVLDAKEYHLHRSVQLHLEVMGHRWILHTGKECHVPNAGSQFSDLELTDGRVINLVTEAGDELTLVVVDCGNILPVTRKFMFDSVQKLSIGKGPDNDVQYVFRNFVSKHHAEIVRHSDGVYLEDYSTNGTYRNGVKIKGTTGLHFGDQIQIFGLLLVYLGSIICILARAGELNICPDSIFELHKASSMVVNQAMPQRPAETYFNRSPRAMPEIYHDKVSIENVPDPHPYKKKPLILTIGPPMTMALPMMIGCLMVIYGMQSSGSSASAFMYTGIIVALGSAILGTLWAVLNLRNEKKEEYEAERTRVDSYGNYLMRQVNTLWDKYRHNTEAMKQTYPAPEKLCRYGISTPMLWNRDFQQDDFLFMRLGLGSVPFQVEIDIPQQRFSLQKDILHEKPAEIQSEFSELKDVPIGIDLRREKLVGVVGDETRTTVVYSILAGLTANCCYTDVKLVMVCKGDSRKDLQQWDFVRWFPHVWNENRTIRYFSAGKDEAGDVFYELGNVMREREQAAEETEFHKETPRPYYILIVEDISLLEGEMIEKYVYAKDDSLGLTTIMLAERSKDLPNACQCIIESDKRFHGIYHPLQSDAKPIRFDKPNARQLLTLARSLSGLRVHEVENSAEIPDQVDFLSMYQVRDIEELDIPDRWCKNRTYNSLRVPIGIKAGGSLCCLDIHEKFHGPHGLLAGTTGSGKSETLQTYILSLAVNFSPEDVGFFIIDFKGGGMANLFNGLPHMLGQISNLSGNQVRRAMISIKSENRRRQRIFNEYDVNNINSYTRLYKNGEAQQPIPHLFIIIDEFAELKKEEPDFMRELISVAQVGRSLGVHLILSTQKPSGTVDDNIWSNSKFRLCLRVQTRQDSNDMLHRPDAAFITQAGRCFFQVGNDEIYEQFQSAWSGAPYNEKGELQEQPAAVLLTRGGRPNPTGSHVRLRRKKQGTVSQRTQLDALVGYLADVAEEEDLAPVTRLWLPLLPTELDVHTLKGWEENAFDGRNWPERTGNWSLDTPAGLMDDPENQLQFPLNVDFAGSGHIAVCASVFSGKSTLIQTIVYGLLMRYSPDELNMYLLDFSSQMLSCFSGAPHVGAVMDESDPDYIGNFMYMIEGIMDERKRVFKGGNYSQYVRVNGVTMPAIVVVIDNYAAFAEKTEDKYDSIMLRIAREGVSYGIFLLISAADFGLSGIPNRISENLKTVLCLSLPDKFKYMELLHAGSVQVLPESGVPGRGLAVYDGRPLEFQAAVASLAGDDYARSKEIDEDCRRMRDSWKGEKAQPVPRIPEQPTFSLLRENKDYAAAQKDPARLPVGYRQDNGMLYSIDLSRTYCYLVAGREHTGRLNVMKLLMQAGREKGAQLVVYEKENGRLHGFAEQNGARCLLSRQELFDFWNEFQAEFVRRNHIKNELVEQGLGDNEIFERMKEEQPVFFFISDLNDFFHSVYSAEEGSGDMRGFMENILQKGALHNIYFFARMSVGDHANLSSWAAYRYFTDRQNGVLLGGNSGGQRVFNFQNIPYNQQSKTLQKGIGLAADFADDTQAVTVVLPLADR